MVLEAVKKDGAGKTPPKTKRSKKNAGNKKT